MPPSPLIPPFFLLQFLSAATGTLTRGDEADLINFSNLCPPQNCSLAGPQIRFPLRLASSPPSSFPAPLLDEPYWPRCLLLNTTDLDFISSAFSLDSRMDFILVNCSRPILFPEEISNRSVSGPISCFSGFVYAVEAGEYMSVLPPYCAATPGAGWLPWHYLARGLRAKSDLTSSIDLFIMKREVVFNWEGMGEWPQCSDCEFDGGRCGFSEARNQSFCYQREHRSKAKLTVGTCVGGATSVIILASIIVFYINKKSSNQEDMRLKVENFLATYQNTKPTRYSFSEIKKITARFKHKLGRGGFGTVYKGELPNGIPVAVKLIEVENSSGEEFINEVATIGRIHHINIVRLLRFCSQRTMLALIYEFMPNESLEKFIFSGESSDRFRPKLNVAQLQQIAVGIAQGIEYLHQGCDQRILHFDIKPHNILLDHSFVPKISDFGFAKLCSRDQSRIPMTVARGTMGYIAPEIYSRNFGAASGKSDVYSFGMLLMEMVSWRKNVDPSIDDQSSVYFPEWIYEQLVRGRDLDLVLEVREDEEEIAKKLIVVALWCVQWSPVDRPSMTRVVQMLLGEFTDLEIPPKPFVSSSLENVVPVNTA